MATKKSGISEYLAEIGRRGGQAKGRKGFAAMDDEQRKAIAAKGVKTRQKNAAARKKAAKKAI